MTKNADGGSICSRIERLINEYEQAREADSTEIGRQFAVREEIFQEELRVLPCFLAITKNDDRE